ncbi:MAG: gephyrin-like molybdotransferase Glp, partial [Acidimicrobiales bacterium]
MPHSDEALTPLADAQQLALARSYPLPPLRIGIDEALGLVVAEDVVAAESVPPFANSAMDGYAVRAEDCQHAGAELDVVGVIPAGAGRDLAVGPGQAAQIMTGAPVPSGANAIAIVERTEALGEVGGGAAGGGAGA